MRRVIRTIAGWSLGLSFALAPVILLFMYLTYSEKLIAPILMLIVIISTLILIFTDEE